MSTMTESIEQYDIIIIGAGTAGSAVASRLSTQSDLAILVLEAGENRNDDPNIYTPGLARKLLDNPDYDWQFQTQEEPGLYGRSIKHPRGKVVGGSSAINSFALLYPNRAGIDVWEEMGNEGWNFETLQPYFEKFQTLGRPNEDVRQQLSLAHSAEAVERTNGPLRTCFPSRVTPLQKAWEGSWRALGLESSNDAFDGDAIGGHTSVCHISSDTKQRSHAGEAFLGSLATQDNLTVITGALVECITFSKDGSPAVATGVQYTKDSRVYVAAARRKVILAAGSLASPAILERSGIGDRQRLSALVIPVVYHNAGVGENLQDHIRGAVHFEAADHVPARALIPDDEAREMYEVNRSGPWAESACWTFAYMPLLPLMDPKEQADWESMVKKSIPDDKTRTSIDQKRREYIKKISSSPTEAAATAFLSRRPYAPAESTDMNWIVLCAMLSHSLSRGSVHIKSASPDKHTEIKFNYYSNEFDLEVHARIMKGLLQLAATEPLSQCLKSDGKREPPLTLDSSLEDVKSVLRKYAGTNYHPVGTCSMLPEEDGGVVDSTLKVYGTENLHVVDASIMPVIPRANVISTVYAVAERAADLLLEELGSEKMA